MSIISNEMRFLGVNSSLVNLIEKKDSTNNEKTEYYSLDDIRGYKVYTALLTQNGGGSAEGLNSGPVTKGVTYEISGIDGDFSNVGAPNNNDDTFFVAINNEIPNSYGTSTLKFDTGAPVVTVLENTIGNIWFTYEGVGNYFTNSTGFFLINKYFAPQASNGYDADVNNSGGGDPYNWYRINDNQISILINGDNRLNNSPIEIRVY